MSNRRGPRAHGGALTRDSGFSLVELLVVLTILGLLAAIAVPVLISQREKAAAASLRSDLRTVATAIESARNADGDLAVTHADVAKEAVTSPGNVVEVVLDGNEYCLSATRGSQSWVFDTSSGGMAAATGSVCTGPVAFVLP